MKGSGQARVQKVFHGSVSELFEIFLNLHARAVEELRNCRPPRDIHLAGRYDTHTRPQQQTCGVKRVRVPRSGWCCPCPRRTQTTPASSAAFSPLVPVPTPSPAAAAPPAATRQQIHKCARVVFMTPQPALRALYPGETTCLRQGGYEGQRGCERQRCAPPK